MLWVPPRVSVAADQFSGFGWVALEQPILDNSVLHGLLTGNDALQKFVPDSELNAYTVAGSDGSLLRRSLPDEWLVVTRMGAGDEHDPVVGSILDGVAVVCTQWAHCWHVRIVACFHMSG